MNIETLFSSYQVVDQYLRLMTLIKLNPKPEIQLRAVDAFLMKQFAAFYPVAPTVVDLAAEQTLGATTVLWASAAPYIRQVIASKVSWQSAPSFNWRQFLTENFDQLGLDSARVTLKSDFVDQPGVWPVLNDQIGASSPLILVFAATSQTVSDITVQLQKLMSLSTNAFIFLLPLGAIGEDYRLEAAFSLCRFGTPYRLTVFRELAPFFSSSQLGLIFDRDNTFVLPILERIRQMFNGNFGFLQLLEDNTKLKLRVQRLESENAFRSSALPERLAPEIVPQTEGLPPVQAQAPSRPSMASYSIQQQLRGKLGLKLAKIGLSAFGQLLLPIGHLTYKVDYLEFSVPHEMQTGEVYESRVRLRNSDNGPWLSSKQVENGVNVSYHWYSADGKLTVKEGLRTVLSESIQPGEIADVSFQVLAPDHPGQYVLHPDLVHEGVMWFSEAKSASPSFKVLVR